MSTLGEEKFFSVYEKWPTPHLRQVLNSFLQLKKCIDVGIIYIDGQSLDTASVVALAR